MKFENDSEIRFFFFSVAKSYPPKAKAKIFFFPSFLERSCLGISTDGTS